MPDPIPTHIGKRYRPIGILGSGNSATVYRCADESGFVVAVKKYKPEYGEGTYRQRLAGEVKTLLASSSPHVLKILDWDRDLDGAPYLVTEIAESSVCDMACAGALGVQLAAWIVYQAASGLRSTSAIHRDLKPENLLIMKQPGGRDGFTVGGGNGVRVVVADWGLCRPDGSAGLTKTIEVMGTPYYMSPEQCRSMRNTDKRTDIYALGIIFWELSLGTMPFHDEDPYEILRQQVESEPPWPTHLPAPAIRILKRALAKDPQNRYSSFAELQAALKPLISDNPDWAYPPDGAPDAPVTTPLALPDAI